MHADIHVCEHDAVVPDPVVMVKGVRMDLNVLNDASKKGTCTSLVQIDIGLSAPYLHKSSISILSCSK